MLKRPIFGLLPNNNNQPLEKKVLKASLGTTLSTTPKKEELNP